MADGHVARKRAQVVFVENLRHEPLAFHPMERTVVYAHDAAPLLSAMLERMKSVIGERCGLLHAENAENAALLMDLPVLIISHLYCPPNKNTVSAPPHAADRTPYIRQK
jgi:hypothetical protein